MRILLVAPRASFPDTTPAWVNAPQMSLLILEALTGKEHQVVIAEEEREPLPLEEKWDLVGITAMTATAPRAYALADEFRKTGARVVLGGIHPSVLPEEASRHADAVVVGEAEAVWPQILEEATRQTLKQVYANPFPEDLAVPLVNYRHHWQTRPVVSPMITSRGCPNGCEFCSVPRIYGSRIRNLPVSHVVEQLRRHQGDLVAFLDDNLTACREYALELFSALADLKIKSVIQTSVRFILDEELFALAVKSGLKGIFVGFETIDEKSLQRIHKPGDLQTYVAAIRRCRKAGVILHASFIFGLDEHDASIFPRTLDFVMQHQITSVGATVLTPYPGTAVFHRFLKEERLLHQNWTFYDSMTPVFRPARMTLEELSAGYLQFRLSTFSLRGILRRLPAGLAAGGLAYFSVNAAWRRASLGIKQHYRNYFRWLKEAHLESS
jgi:radical SAM superfamily enzyme YgiQ (UPF0313 family)